MEFSRVVSLGLLLLIGCLRLLAAEPEGGEGKDAARFSNARYTSLGGGRTFISGNYRYRYNGYRSVYYTGEVEYLEYDYDSDDKGLRTEHIVVIVIVGIFIMIVVISIICYFAGNKSSAASLDSLSPTQLRQRLSPDDRLTQSLRELDRLVDGCGAEPPLYSVSQNGIEPVTVEDSSGHRKMNCNGNFAVRSYFTMRFHCGETVLNCKCCDGICGPLKGCNCEACRILDLEFGVGFVRNSEGALAKKAPNGLFYCNRGRVLNCSCCPSRRCGPNEGCNCRSCQKLDLANIADTLTGHYPLLKGGRKPQASPHLTSSLGEPTPPLPLVPSAPPLLPLPPGVSTFASEAEATTTKKTTTTTITKTTFKEVSDSTSSRGDDLKEDPTTEPEIIRNLKSVESSAILKPDLASKFSPRDLGLPSDREKGSEIALADSLKNTLCNSSETKGKEEEKSVDNSSALHPIGVGWNIVVPEKKSPEIVYSCADDSEAPPPSYEEALKL